MMNLKSSVKICFRSFLFINATNASQSPVINKCFFIESKARLSYEHPKRIALFNRYFHIIITPNTPFMPVILTNDPKNNDSDDEECDEYLYIQNKNPNAAWSSYKHGFPLSLLYLDSFTLYTKHHQYNFTKQADDRHIILKRAERIFSDAPLRYTNHDNYTTKQLIDALVQQNILNETIWGGHAWYGHGPNCWYLNKTKILQQLYPPEEESLGTRQTQRILKKYTREQLIQLFLAYNRS
jgi:hypothetical protein